MTKNNLKLLAISLVAVGLLVGCGSDSSTPVATPTPTVTPTETPTAEPSTTPTPDPGTNTEDGDLLPQITLEAS